MTTARQHVENANAALLFGLRDPFLVPGTSHPTDHEIADLACRPGETDPAYERDRRAADDAARDIDAPDPEPADHVGLQRRADQRTTHLYGSTP